jgi:hypothetical protein
MRLRYFVIDGQGQLRKASQAGVKALWRGCRGADALGCPGGSELRLVSVLCDDALLPQRVYVLRLPLTKGRFTPEDNLALKAFSTPEYVTPGEALSHHTAGWPRDFFRQLAVALDVPVVALHVPLGIGGPLLVAAARDAEPHQVVRHLR